MKLAIINGSPRNKKSNSTLLMDQFLIGYHSQNSEEVPIHYLANPQLKKRGNRYFYGFGSDPHNFSALHG